MNAGVFEVYYDGVKQDKFESFLSEEFAYFCWDDITKSSGISTYTITEDQNCDVNFTINDGTKILNELNKFSIEDLNGNLVYKQGSILKRQSNIIQATSFNPTTREITLNAEPKVDFRVNYYNRYTRDDVPEGKVMTGDVVEISDIVDVTTDDKKTENSP